MQDYFCEIYIDSDISLEIITRKVMAFLGGKYENFTIISPTLDLNIEENNSFDQLKRFSSFIYFKYIIEIEPAGFLSPEDYIESVSNLLEWLWQMKIPAVAACDFEEKLPKNGKVIIFG